MFGSPSSPPSATGRTGRRAGNAPAPRRGAAAHARWRTRCRSARSGSRVTGMPAWPRAAGCSGPRRPPPAGRTASARPPTCTSAPSARRSTRAAAGANTDSDGSSCSRALIATRRLRASTIQPKAPPVRRGRRVATSRLSKCRNSCDAGRPSRPSETRMSRIGPGRNGSRRHSPACLQHAARAGGDGVGAAVEIRMLHRRQRGAVDDGGADARRAQPARQRAAHRAGAHDADIDLASSRSSRCLPALRPAGCRTPGKRAIRRANARILPADCAAIAHAKGRIGGGIARHDS